MLLKDEISYIKSAKVLYKVLVFFILLLILPAIFKIIEQVTQSYLGLNRYINVFDFIFVSFMTFCFVKRDKLRVFSSIPLILSICLVFLMRLSLFFSQGEIHYHSFYDLFKTFIAILLFFSFFTKTFQKNSQSIIKSFLVIFFTIALFESMLGILQFILQRPLGFFFFNEPAFGGDIQNSATVYISENKQFFINKLINNQSNYFLRAHGTFLHPNIFSGFLNISSILTLFLIYKSEKKLFFSMFLGLQLVALILTFSRAGLASFVITSFLFFLLMLLKKYDVKKMFLVFILGFIFVTLVFSKYLVERGFTGRLFQSNLAKELNIGSSNTRSLLQEASINMIKKRPLLGVGFRNFLIKENEYSKEKLERAYVHNIYLVIASETGLISLFIFLIVLGLIFIDVFRYCLTPLNIAILCCVSSFLLIGFFDHYPISTHFGRIILFGFLGFLNYSIKVNKLTSCSQKAFLYQ